MTNLTNFNAWTDNNTHIPGEFIRAYRVSFLLYGLYYFFCTLIIVYCARHSILSFLNRGSQVDVTWSQSSDRSSMS